MVKSIVGTPPPFLKRGCTLVKMERRRDWHYAVVRWDLKKEGGESEEEEEGIGNFF